MTWTKQKRDKSRPSPAHLQPENGILGKPKPAESIAQSDAPPPPRTRAEQSNARKRANAQQVNYTPTLKPERTKDTPNRLHSARTEAMQALALPDIAPPPSVTPAPMTPEQQAVLASLNLDSFAASLNQNGEITAALAPQAKINGKISDHTDDELFELISRGYLQIEIARMWGVQPMALSEYIRGEPTRSARMLRAKDNAAQACDAKAMEVLRTARPEDAYKARAISSYLQWRASRMSPDYQDASRVKVEGGMTIQHEVPERAPITDLISEALKPFSTKIIDVSDE